MLELELTSETDLQPDAARVTALIRQTLRHEQAELRRVAISFVDPATMQRLNKQYRDRDRPTDVLSFPFDDSFPSGAGGELLVCPEEAALGAAAAGISPAAQLDQLIVHGTLHLLGYEDETDRGRDQMAARTTAILKQLTGMADG